MRITVDPDRLRVFAQQMERANNDLLSMEARLNRVITGLDWEARQQASADWQLNVMRRTATNLANEATQLARYLNSKAQTFEEADNYGSETIGRTSGAYAEFVRGLEAGTAPGALLTRERIEELKRAGLLTGDTDAILSAQVAALAAGAPLALGRGGLQEFFKRGGEAMTLLELTRTGLRGDLRTYGRVLNALSGGNHAGWVGRMERLMDYIPVRDARSLHIPKGVFVAADPILEFLGEGDYSTRGAIMAGATSGVTMLAAYAIPGVGTALAVSAGVQFVGGLTMMGLEAAGQKEWADKGREALEAVDLHAHARNATEWAVDHAAEAWQSSPARRIFDLGTFVPEWRAN